MFPLIIVNFNHFFIQPAPEFYEAWISYIAGYVGRKVEKQILCSERNL